MMQARLITYSALAGADSRSYQSVRLRPVSRVERFEVGRRLRQDVPRASLGEWRVPDTRQDPVAFLRGAAVVMANDLANLPATVSRCPRVTSRNTGPIGARSTPTVPGVPPIRTRRWTRTTLGRNAHLGDSGLRSRASRRANVSRDGVESALAGC
jgi:hypothetical protein